MRKVYIAVLVVMAVLIIGIVYAEQMTFSTYYPAPFGVYNQMVVRTLGVGDMNDDGSINYLDAPDPNDEGQANDLWVAGNVGIGTTDPEAKLQIIGAIRAGGGADGTSTVLYSGTCESGSPAGMGDGWRIRQVSDFFGPPSVDALVIEKTDGNDDNPDGGIAFVNTGIDGIEKMAMVIRGNGRVGIGTDRPSNKLEILDGTVRSTATVPGFITQESDAGDQEWQMLGVAGEFRIRDLTAGNVYPFRIEPDQTSSDVLYLDNTGNVGIGTTRPEVHPEGDPGNLDVNDVYLRSTSQWLSQGGGAAFGTLVDKGYFPPSEISGTDINGALAETDGFFLGYIEKTTSNNGGGWLEIKVSNNSAMTSPTTLAKIGAVYDGDYGADNRYASFFVPVKKDQYYASYFTASANRHSLRQYYWMPLGQ